MRQASLVSSIKLCLEMVEKVLGTVHWVQCTEHHHISQGRFEPRAITMAPFVA